MSLPNPTISSDNRIDASYLADQGRDYLISHGVLLHDIKCKPNRPLHTPFAVYPSPLPRALYYEATTVQKDFNLLIDRVSRDHEFLKEALEHTVTGDPLTRRLFEIYSKAQEQGIYDKTVTVGLTRCDYFCEAKEPGKELQLKQVEVNVICDSSGHPTGVTELCRSYYVPLLGLEDHLDHVLPNASLQTKADGLIQAWKLYGSPSSAIMFISFPREEATFYYDHRHLEYAVRERCPGLRVIRGTMADIYNKGKVTDDGTLYVDGQEIGMAYYRDGYTPEHYPTEEWFLGREMAELSRCAKCPSIAYQLVALKKMQEVFARPGVLERFFDDQVAIKRMRNTFAQLYSIDKGEEGDRNVAMALKDPKKFVLKAQRDGGGFDSVFFNEDIVKQLKGMPDEERSQFVLMDKIEPVTSLNCLVHDGQTEVLVTETQNELGIQGVIISDGKKVVFNENGGYLMRSKKAGQAGGSISTGVYHHSCIYLLD